MRQRHVLSSVYKLAIIRARIAYGVAVRRIERVVAVKVGVRILPRNLPRCPALRATFTEIRILAAWGRGSHSFQKCRCTEVEFGRCRGARGAGVTLNCSGCEHFKRSVCGRGGGRRRPSWCCSSRVDKNVVVGVPGL